MNVASGGKQVIRYEVILETVSGIRCTFFYRKISKICRYSNMKGVTKVQFTSVNSYNCEQFCFI